MADTAAIGRSVLATMMKRLRYEAVLPPLTLRICPLT